MFMEPQIAYMTVCYVDLGFGGETGTVPKEDVCAEMTVKEEETGWFGRMSAPGYLDCTEWSGPHASAEEALEDLCDMYAQDEEEEAEFRRIVSQIG